MDEEGSDYESATTQSGNQRAQTDRGVAAVTSDGDDNQEEADFDDAPSVSEVSHKDVPSSTEILRTVGAWIAGIISAGVALRLLIVTVLAQSEVSTRQQAFLWLLIEIPQCFHRLTARRWYTKPNTSKVCPPSRRVFRLRGVLA